MASQVETETGSDNTRRVTPLRVKEAIDVQAAALSILVSTDAGEGAGLVGFKQDGADAVARDTGEKMRETVSVTDFGTAGTGLADDSSAFLAAATKVSGDGGGRVLIPPGTYIVHGVELAGLANVEFVGVGAVIKGPVVRVQAYFNCTGAANITFSGIRFDQMKASLPTFTSSDYASGPLNVPIYVNGGGAAQITAQHCQFLDLYTSAVFFANAAGLIVRHCDFQSGQQVQDQWMQHIHCQTATDIEIAMCTIINAAPASIACVPGGIFASGVRRIAITGCRFVHCGRDNTGSHRVGTIDFYGDVTDVFVNDSILEECHAVALRLNAGLNCHVENNRFQINAEAESGGNIVEVTGSTIFGGNKGSKNVTVRGNTFEDLSHRAAVAVLVQSYDWGAPSTDITVSDNIYRGCINPARVIGPFDGVTITGNRAREGRGAIVVLPGTSIASDLGNEADSFYYDLNIAKNVLRNSAGDDANAILIALGNVTTALVDGVAVEKNSVWASPASAAPAVVIQLNSSDKARTHSKVAGNAVSDYASAFDIRDHGSCDLIENRATGTTNFLLTSGMSAAPVSRGNISNGTRVAETALAT